MRSMCRGALALFALAFAMSAMASSALAAPEWKAETPEWQQGGSSISSAATTLSKGAVKLQDSNATLRPLVECEETAEGSAGPGAVGVVTSVTYSKCVTKTSGVTCETPVAVDLPWHSELTLAGATQNVIAEGGKGAPGYKVTCTAVGVKATDTCTGTTLMTEMANVAGGVNATFDGKLLNCTLGGAGQGKMEGTLLVEATKGGKLEVHTELNKLTKALNVTGEGEPTLTDAGGGLVDKSATCSVKTEGTIGPAGAGTITGYTVSTCGKTSGQCGAVLTARPLKYAMEDGTVRIGRADRRQDRKRWQWHAGMAILM